MIHRIKLGPGESLQHASSRTRGTWHETDETHYTIIDAAGRVVGSLVHTDHTSQRGKRTQSIVQRDASGKVIADESW